MKKMEKILTVSIAAYNAESVLSKCLDSFADMDRNVINQIEILVINDGSQDSTAEVAETYVRRFPESIRLISQENGGHGSTINTAIINAVGKYFKIVDSDDWVNKEGIEKLVAYLKDTEVDLVLNPFCVINASDGSVIRTEMPYRDSEMTGILIPLPTDGEIAPSMHAMTIRTDILKKVGPIIDRHCFYVDAEYTVFTMKYINTVVCNDYPVYEYMTGISTQSMSIQNMIHNCSQHIKVIKRVTDYYEDCKDDLTKAQRMMMSNQIRRMIRAQYLIFYYMQDKDGKSEMVKFDLWLKACSLDLYAGYGKLMKIVQLDRMSHFRLYRLSSKMVCLHEGVG